MNMEYILIVINNLAIDRKILGKIINFFEENECYVVRCKICKLNINDLIIFDNNFIVNDSNFDYIILVLKGYNLISKMSIIVENNKINFSSIFIDDYFFNLSDYISYFIKDIKINKKLILYFFEDLFIDKIINEKN